MTTLAQARVVVGTPLKRLVGVIVLLGFTYGVGREVLNPSMLRVLIALGFGVLLIGLSVKNPKMTMFLLVIYLPLMGFIRRALIPTAGWGSFDPLVVVAPGVMFLLGSYWVYRTFIMREPYLKHTKLFTLVRWMILIDFLEVVNPHQGGIFAGVAGLMFYVVPLFWMVLSKQHLTDRWMRAIFGTVFLIGTLGALYGLKQTFYGFYSFEKTWINISGYAALIIGQKSRAFSSFTSAAEYAQYLGITLSIAWVYLLQGGFVQRILAIPAIGAIGYALFLESSRGPIVTGALAITIVSIVSVRRGWPRWTVAVITSGALVGLYIALGHMHAAGNALIAHQVDGLTHPLNSKDSTAGMHFGMLVSGLTRGITHPLGSGLGATTLAVAKLGNSADASNSEIDLSNMAISNGLAGELVYLFIIIRVILLVFSACKTRQKVPLLILGVLIVTVTEWSNGGDYSTTAFVWLCIGYLDKITAQSKFNIIRERSNRPKFKLSPQTWRG